MKFLNKRKDILKKSGIYKITNTVNGKFYIGSSTNLGNRFSVHKTTLKNNYHDNQYLQNSYNKYGGENFTIEVVEFCEKNEVVEREQFWIDVTKCNNRSIGYNRRKNAENNISIDYVYSEKRNFNNSKLSGEQVRDIKLLQRDTKLTQKQISNLFGVSSCVVGLISRGKTFTHVKISDSDVLDKERYGNTNLVRKVENGKLSEEQVKDIKLLLRDYGNTYSTHTIAQLFNIVQSTVGQIKDGKKHKKITISEEESFDFNKYDFSAIKKKKRILSIEEAREIKLLLRDTNLMNKEIANIFGCAINRVAEINTGRVFADVKLEPEDKLNYEKYNHILKEAPVRPVRKNITEQQRSEILNLLTESKFTQKKIGEMFNVSASYVNMIKKGTR